jgi:3-deoxy-D-manno-octulosonic-acid transferase
LIFYSIISLLLQGGLRLASPFAPSVRKFLKSRSRVFDKIEAFGQTRKPRKPVYWFHCASLGEFEQGRPLIEALKARDPEAQIVLSFFSPSGYEVRKNYDLAELVCYLPLDSPANARRFIRLVRPDAAFFIRYEFWYAYLSVLEKENIPAISVATLLLPGLGAFRWYGGFYRRMLRKVSFYFAQNEETARLLQKIGIDRVKVAGDTRFDRVAAICETAPRNEVAEAFKENTKLMVIGSSWPQDLDVLLPFMKEVVDDVKFIIAPHHIHEEEIQRIEKEIPYKSVRYSRVKPETISNYQVLIIDNIGMLTSLYRYGEFAYVGGAFGKSLHNILEAATFGMPIFFGSKSYRHVREANELLRRGSAFTINDSDELRTQFLRLLNDEEERQAIALDCRAYVQKNTGASAQVMKYVAQHLEKKHGS